MVTSPILDVSEDLLHGVFSEKFYRISNHVVEQKGIRYVCVEDRQCRNTQDRTLPWCRFTLILLDTKQRGDGGWSLNEV